MLEYLQWCRHYEVKLNICKQQTTIKIRPTYCRLVHMYNLIFYKRRTASIGNIPVFGVAFVSTIIRCKHPMFAYIFINE